MTAELRDRQLQRCCDALAAVGADAPTLCSGWSVHDLAIHLWLLKRDPISWVGMGLPALAWTLARRAELLRRSWSYPELISMLRAEPGQIACMPLDRFENYRHSLGEYFVHTQDVVRANGLDQDSPDDGLQDALWIRVQVAARLLHRRTGGLVLERMDGRSARITAGTPAVVVQGEPTELICWVYGRASVADVRVRRSGG